MAWFLFGVAFTACACFIVVWIINSIELKRTRVRNQELEALEPTMKKRCEVLRKDAENDAAHQRRMASLEAEDIVEDATQRARQLGAEADLYQSTVISMRNIIDGYGDEYLVPTSGLLDELAEDYAHQAAGQELKIARKHSKLLVKSGKAAACDYEDDDRRERAQDFVLDAFNGKVDTILSKVKHDNAGVLRQKVFDAYTLVNFGGTAFQKARITEEYLRARQGELRWAVVVQELKLQEREEQRRVREQIREEEKARREYEKAIKEAAKEEAMLKKAMLKAEKKIQAATMEQRAEFEAELELLRGKLTEAEEKNIRAVSMAQMTRRGHVYIISNKGSFGKDVFKIGLTRRLEPLDRVKELGDSSVPFTFDVHAMIMSDDAPALENKLHKHFLMNQVNKVNHRKEFFRAKLSDIRAEIENTLGIKAKWTMAAEAREYRETLAIEHLIETNPEAKEAWLSKQLTLDPVDIAEINSNAGL
tara:strand:+ start:356 stop:1786 length:1431 start_codon:yes stop_codon:yes gene_type:complete